MTSPSNCWRASSSSPRSTSPRISTASFESSESGAAVAGRGSSIAPVETVGTVGYEAGEALDFRTSVLIWVYDTLLRAFTVYQKPANSITILRFGFYWIHPIYLDFQALRSLP